MITKNTTKKAYLLLFFVFLVSLSLINGVLATASISGLPDFTAITNGAYQVNINSYSSNSQYTSSSITFTDPDNSQTITILDGQQSTNSYFSASLSSNVLTIGTFNKVRNSGFNINVRVCDVPFSSCVQGTDTFNLAISSQVPRLKNPLPTTNLDTNGSILLLGSDLFGLSSFDKITMTYADTYLSQTISLIANKSLYSQSCSSGSVYACLQGGTGGGVQVLINYNNRAFGNNITITGHNNYYNSDTSTSANFTATASQQNNGSGNATSLFNGSIAFFNFNEGSGTKFIDYFNKTNLTLYGGAVWSTTQKQSTAYSGYITSGSGANITDGIGINNHINASFSLSGWIYITDNNYLSKPIISRDTPSSSNYNLVVTDGSNCGGTTNKLGICMQWYDNTLSSWQKVLADINVSRNTAHIITGVFNGTATTIYLDGSQVAQNTSIRRPDGLYINGVLGIGNSFQASVSGSTSYYLDDVGIWNRSLTTTEITALLQQGSSPTPWVSSSSLPTKLFNITDIELTRGQYASIVTSSYFSSFNDLNITLYNSTSGTNKTINSQSGVYNNITFPEFNLSISGDSTKTITFYPFNQTYIRNIYVEVCNINGCTNDTFLLTINANPPTRTFNLITPFIIGLNSSRTINLSANWENMTYFTLNFNSSTGSVINLVSGETYGDNILTIDTENPSIISVTSYNQSYSFSAGIGACNLGGCDYNDNTLFFNITSGGVTITSGTPQSAFSGISNGFSSLYPDSSTLSLKQRMGFMFATMIIINLCLLIPIFLTTGELSSGGLYLSLFLDFIMFIYFVAIGYVPVSAVIIGLLIIIALAYMKFKGGSE